MAQVYEQIRQAGGEVLVISFASADKVKTYLQKYPQPFPVVADPERTAYKAMALGSTTLGGILWPGVIWRYLKMMLRGWWPSKFEGDDIYQLGGDFVLDAEGRLSYAHPSKEPTDRPPAQKLLEAVKSAQGP